ncbi:MAG: 16S rRNA (adenine(1518)-N(6)/adenine(1519)-N(6))-dimethyltransferase RsmA [Rhodocyclaceae bacterium]|nr:16S rRNA (adenine(1518)-N(6)/adenine(1519)-N(6))-dimethyltransferase RsmA [Rhodocyclaceae bacterium]
MQEHRARKRFGQNFLSSSGVIASIISAINPKPDDCMVEIGPGLGAMTVPLMDTLKHLHVVEIDRDLIARLKQNHRQDKLTIHEGDALEFDFGGLSEKNLRIVGNLPYNISTPILFHLSRFATQVRDMHFMLQKEVVDRMVAEPGSSEFGRLSVMLQYRYDMDRLFIVPPDAFVPAPKVDSAIVRMIPRPVEALTAKDEALFGDVVTAAFSQRRKMLRNTLKGIISETGLEALGIAPTARAETLAVSDYVRITNSLS